MPLESRLASIFALLIILVAVVYFYQFVLPNNWTWGLKDNTTNITTQSGTFTNRENITITNTYAPLTDFQLGSTGYKCLNITFQTNMSSDFKDLRLTNSTNWNMSWGQNYTYAIESVSNGNWVCIWPKITDIPNGTSTIWAYWGNSSLSKENNTSAFEMFDDFNSTLNTTLWLDYGTGGAINIAGDSINLTNGGAGTYRVIASKMGFTRPFVFETLWTFTNVTYGEDTFTGFGSWNGTSNFENQLDYWGFAGRFRTDQLNCGLGYDINNTLPSIMTGVINWDSTHINTTRNGTLLNATGTCGQFNTNVSIGVGGGGSSGGRSSGFDMVRVRKYASPYPSVSFGSPEIVPSTSSVAKQETQLYKIFIILLFVIIGYAIFNKLRY